MTAILYVQIQSQKVFGPIVPSMVHLGESNLRPFRKSFSGTQNQPNGTLIFFFTKEQNKRLGWCLFKFFCLKGPKKQMVDSRQNFVQIDSVQRPKYIYQVLLLMQEFCIHYMIKTQLQLPSYFLRIVAARDAVS